MYNYFPTLYVFKTFSLSFGASVGRVGRGQYCPPLHENWFAFSASLSAPPPPPPPRKKEEAGKRLKIESKERLELASKTATQNSWNSTANPKVQLATSAAAPTAYRPGSVPTARWVSVVGGKTVRLLPAKSQTNQIDPRPRETVKHLTFHSVPH